MTKPTRAHLLGLAAGIALLALPAAATAAGPGRPQTEDLLAPAALPTSGDCSRARDASRCLAIPKARAICQGKRGSARRQCLRANLPAPDCTQAPDPRQCQARQQASLACQGKPGKQRRQCLAQAAALPPPISSIN